MKQNRIHRFSLLELIICLGILAVLAAILLDNFADVKARECGDQTRERGEQIRNAVKGTFADDGISAFLSDMGRFPSVYIPSSADGGDGNGGRRLAELYDPSIWYSSSSGTALQQRKTISGAELQTICRSVPGSTFPADGSGIDLPYPEITMNAGWNGPYLNITSPVQGNLYDGWGNAWKIISNYNLRINGNRLEENTAASNGIRIYATETEINALRDSSGNARCRIDGIISYGANDTDDSAETDVDPADADQKFLFAHPMDTHSMENLATLTVTLKLRDTRTGEWIKLPPISTWQADHAYRKGELVSAGGTMYCCTTAHTSGTAFSAANWAAVTAAANYDPTIHGALNFKGLCIYENTCYLRLTTNAESAFTPANWLRIAGAGELPDSVSLFIFTPVMQGSYDERIMQAGYYHFYRNSTAENAHGVKPLYGTAGSEDIDCEGDTSTIYGSSDDYNARYLIAEDHSGASWNEFFIKRLIPGRRKIFCMIYSSSATSCYQSAVEELKLKPGNNFVTLCLERKL